MNTMKKITIIALAALVLVGCKKDFLDQKPYSGVPFGDAVKDEAAMQAALAGTYSGLRTPGFLSRAFPIINDILADNAFISTQNSNRYTAFYNVNYINSSADAQTLFADAYNAILRANTIINSTLTANANVNQMRGEALTIRALSYFSLIQLYAKPFAVDPAAPGVPLILTYDPNFKPARATVQAIYDQIEKDLNEAFGSMTLTKSSGFITKYVAKALLSRVYQAKGDWTKSRDAALDVINNSGFTLVAGASLGAFWANPGLRTDKVEVMFEISEDAVNTTGLNSLSYMYAQIGYGDVLATDDLYNQYTATDVRRALFLTGTRAGLTVRIVNKYSNTGNTADKDNVKIVRVAEVLLNLAEAYYKLNDEVNARLRLNQVAMNRDPSFTGYTSTGAALLDDILNERRKELAFEGFRYYDFQRLGRDVVRVNLNTNYQAGVPLTITASNFRRLLPIPLAEIDANPNILPQNTGY
jgi:starch-binding outer membrane protein, SusD/RagB family